MNAILRHPIKDKNRITELRDQADNVRGCLDDMDRLVGYEILLLWITSVLLLYPMVVKYLALLQVDSLKTQGAAGQYESQLSTLRDSYTTLVNNLRLVLALR